LVREYGEMADLKNYASYKEPYDKLFGKTVFNSNWVDSRVVKWTWERMIVKSIEVWNKWDTRLTTT